MKRFLSVLVIFVLLLAGCRKVEVKHSIPREEKKPEATSFVQEREGLWQSEDGTAYVGIFANGMALGFTDSNILVGEWVQEDGAIAVSYESGANNNDGWEYAAGENECSYRYDAETGKLMADETISYVPVYSAEAFRLAADRINDYESAGQEAWMSQADMNMGSAAVSDLWGGLENSLLTYLLWADQDPDALQAEEDQWVTERSAALDAVSEEYAGGSIAALMVASENSRLTEARVEDLLEKLPQ